MIRFFQQRGACLKAARLQQALAGLPDELRTAYLLTVATGASQSEAARVLGMETHEVEARVAEALVQLAQDLDRSRPRGWRDALSAARRNRHAHRA